MILSFLVGGVALAGPVEHIGFGAASQGRGAGGLGLADDVTDVFLNPAGLARLDGHKVAAGFTFYRMGFDEIPDLAWDTNRDGLIDEHDSPLELSTNYGRADGFSFGLGRSIGDRFGLAIAGFFPLDRFIRIRSVDPSLPSWFMYDNRPNRFEFTAGFGWEQLPGMYVGGAVEVMAQSHYDLTVTVDATVGLPREDEGLENLVRDLRLDIHEMNLEMTSSFAPTMAFFWDMGELLPSLEGWNLAATYRGASGLPVDVEVDIQGNITLEETEALEEMTFAVLIPFEISFLDHYLPSRIAGGLAYEHPEKGRLYVDLVRTGWAAATLNLAELTEATIYAPVIGLEQEVEDANANSTVVLKNALGLRLGGELLLPSWKGPGNFGRVKTIARAGGGYESSALESQGANTRLLDSDRIWLAAGAGFQHHSPFGIVPGPLAWNAFFQYHFFAPGALSVKESTEVAGLPLDGSDIPIGGYLLATGLQWSFEY
jgi:hypothetical protein